jgi:hypothetical protein
LNPATSSVPNFRKNWINFGSTVVQKHYDALTQEPQLTAKIAEAIELTLDRTDFGDLNVRVAVRDFPPQGRGALEGKVGADVYISTAVIGEDGEDVSKGMLAHSRASASSRTRDT